MSIERKLASIMFTDISGYTAQMSKDEDKAFSLVQKKREILLPLIQQYEGKLIKEMGDGTLTRYFSADNAIDVASIFQSQTDSDLNVRAGIHTGRVIIDNEDVFGDVVNVASRLESIAIPGSVLVSKETIDKLEISDKFQFVSLGMQSLKGVGRLIEVYAIKDDSLVVPNPDDYTENKIEVHSDDEVPSIAIIPFENKGTKEDVFYAYGISADLISDCSSAGLIRVASLRDVEKLDYNNMETSDLSDKLLVRYVSQGVLWKRGDMFQLSVELYDTKDKKVVWSDRWQEKWDNLPTIKGSLSDGLLKALNIKPKVEKRIDTTNPEAYEFYLKARNKYVKRTNTDDTKIAQGLFKKAIALDYNLISAKTLLGRTYIDMGYYDEAMEILTVSLKHAIKLSDKAGMGESLCNIGIVYYYKSDYEKSLEYQSKSLLIREEIADKLGMGASLTNIGLLHRAKCDYDKAITFYDRSLAIHEELNDKNGVGSSLCNIGLVYSDKNEYDKAQDCYNRSLAIQQELGDKYGMGATLNNIGILHYYKNDYEKALHCYERSLAIQKELGDRASIALTLGNIGLIQTNKGNYDKALEKHTRSIVIFEEINDNRSIGESLSDIGNLYKHKADYDKALDCHTRSLVIWEGISDQYGISSSMNNIGVIHYYKGEYEKAVVNLEKSLNIQKEISSKDFELETTTYLYLTYKYLIKSYDKKEIYRLIKDADNINFCINFNIYRLLEKQSYLKSAYKQVKDQESVADNGLKFLSYPIPKAIVEAWERAK